jgi:ABC-2 type transport system permease protein
LLWLGFTVVYHGTALVALWVILEAFPSMNGWNFREMAFLYALWMLAHAINNTFFSEVNNIPDYIHEGELDRFFVRPLDTLFQTITTPGQVFPDELILALTYFAAATWYSGVHVDLKFALFVPLIAFGGALIDLGINLFVATLAFWFIRVEALQWVVTQLEQEFTRYPISIYSRSVRLLLTFAFPFAFMNYYPATFLLHKPDLALALPPEAGLLTPLIGLAFVSIAYAFWRFGLNRYQGVGH